ncbi:MAG: HAMP domain-containing histidine kinase [bacterium]|nr:HAMP domain-containing histidine kinase [bacterium]
MRRRIFWGVLVAAVVALLIGLAPGAVIRRQQLDANRAELNRQAEVTARLLGDQIQPTLRSDDRLQLRQTLRQSRLIGGYDYLEAAIVDGGGIRSILLDPVLIPMLEVGAFDRPSVRQFDINGTPVFATSRLIRVGEVRLLIVFGREEPLLAARSFTGPLAFGLIAGLALALAVSVLVSRRLGRRLAGLEEAAIGLASGDLGARAPVEGGDDLAELSSTFNHMAASLQRSQRRERDFLMSVGHDLRTPLTTIRGYAEGLAAGIIEPEDFPRVADVLHRQTDRLSRLVEDLMLLARLEAREFTMRPERVDLAAHVKEIVEAHRVRAEKLGVRFEAHIQPVGIVEVDPDRVAQLLGNLVDNALRYTPEQGSVVLSLTGNPELFTLEIADTGPGIDPEDIPRVFERLYVAQHYRPVRPEGSGLGLSIVKELVDALGGRVDVMSEPGHGTTVRLSLPKAVAEPFPVTR